MKVMEGSGLVYSARCVQQMAAEGRLGPVGSCTGEVLGQSEGPSLLGGPFLDRPWALLPVTVTG